MFKSSIFHDRGRSQCRSSLAALAARAEEALPRMDQAFDRNLRVYVQQSKGSGEGKLLVTTMTFRNDAIGSGERVTIGDFEDATKQQRDEISQFLRPSAPTASRALTHSSLPSGSYKTATGGYSATNSSAPPQRVTKMQGGKQRRPSDTSKRPASLKGLLRKIQDEGKKNRKPSRGSRRSSMIHESGGRRIGKCASMDIVYHVACWSRALRYGDAI